MQEDTAIKEADWSSPYEGLQEYEKEEVNDWIASRAIQKLRERVGTPQPHAQASCESDQLRSWYKKPLWYMQYPATDQLEDLGYLGQPLAPRGTQKNIKGYKLGGHLERSLFVHRMVSSG